MGALTGPRMSVAEFLVWNERQTGDGRFELVDGVVVAMSPERLRHARTKLRATNAIQQAISKAGLDCEAIVDSVGVKVGGDVFRIPDVSVVCGDVAGESTFIEAPVILVEVVSPSSEERDVHKKLTEYFRLASLRHYVILYPDSGLLVHHERKGAGGVIETKIIGANGGELVLEPPGLAVPVARLLGTEKA